MDSSGASGSPSDGGGSAPRGGGGAASRGGAPDQGSSGDAAAAGGGSDAGPSCSSNDDCSEQACVDGRCAGDCAPGETRPCYEGPAQTEGVGRCKGGTATCEADGTWSPCAGQTVPSPEKCEADGSDDDCNGNVDDITDVDGDGWTVCEGDCCEVASDGCDAPAQVNPGAIDGRRETPSGALTFTDDDCSGTAGDSRATCDSSLALDDVKGASAAAAVDVCRSVTNDARSWGLVSARYVRANGMPFSPGLQAGLQAAFGSHVVSQRGNRMLLLSTGHARTPSQPGACGGPNCNNGNTGTAPSEFPQVLPGCKPATGIYDDVAFELELRAPSNATGLRVSYAYFAFDKPNECSPYMDQFAVLVSPAPAGSWNGNVAFDATGAITSTKSAFIDVCSGCPLGTTSLQGTGFDTWATTEYPGAATSWLRSTTPVKGGQKLTLRFVIWDAGDHVIDSSVLVDDVEWLTEGTGAVTHRAPPDAEGELVPARFHQELQDSIEQPGLFLAHSGRFSA
jgi:hypothetical protein